MPPIEPPPQVRPATAQARRSFLFVLSILLLSTVALATRLPAPWKLDVINDEMHHLESWRNRYRTDNIYPLFLQRLESGNRLSPGKLDLVKTVYHSSPLIQRGLIILVDPQPPLYPAMAEVIESITRSSLVALRLPSMLFSLLAICLGYLVGRELWDDATGLIVATFVAISAVAQFYAGIGRPYAMVQMAILAAVYAFAREQKANHPSPWRFLLAALLAQSVQWMAWAAVGPLVGYELWRRWRGGQSIPRLLRQTWWYAIGSLLLLAYMAVQLQNPTVSNQAGTQAPSAMWGFFAINTPFGHLGSFGDAPLHTAAAMFAGLILLGAVAAVRHPSCRGAGSIALLLSALGSLAAIGWIGSEMRFMVSYLAIPTVLAAVGLRWLTRTPPAATATAAALLLTVGGVSLWHPEDPYERIDTYDVPWSQVAEALKRELNPGDTWIAFPPNVANNVYRYADFPAPLVPTDEATLTEMVASQNNVLLLSACDVTYPRNSRQEKTFKYRFALLRYGSSTTSTSSTGFRTDRATRNRSGR